MLCTSVLDALFFAFVFVFVFFFFPSRSGSPTKERERERAHLSHWCLFLLLLFLCRIRLVSRAMVLQEAALGTALIAAVLIGVSYLCPQAYASYLGSPDLKKRYVWGALLEMRRAEIGTLSIHPPSRDRQFPPDPSHTEQIWSQMGARDRRQQRHRARHRAAAGRSGHQRRGGSSGRQRADKGSRDAQRGLQGR